MKKHRHRGFICQVGLWNPQIQLQITPFCWGVSVGFSRTKVAVQLGPMAIAIWLYVRGWKVECRTFSDPCV
jgi:hypothetical protein